MVSIVFSDKLPTKGTGILIDYYSEPKKLNTWSDYDIRELISKHEDFWLTEIEKWHREISEKAQSLSRWWWVTEGSRLILWKTTGTFSLKPVLFFLGITELIKKPNIKRIWIINAPDELVAYVTEWNKTKNLIIDKKISINFSNFVKKLYIQIKPLLKLCLDFLRLAFIITLHKKYKFNNKTKLIVDSFAFDLNIINEFGDHYFGRMLDNIKGLQKKSIVWMYEDQPARLSKLKTKLDSLGKEVILKNNICQWSDIWFSLFNSLKLIIKFNNLEKKIPILKAGKILIPSFSSYYIENLVKRKLPFNELILYRQYIRLLSNTNAKYIIYPYEEKTNERAILYAVEDHYSEVITIAYAHAGYSKGHLYIRRGNNGEPPRPKYIAVTGGVAREQFIKYGVNQGNILVVGSPRFHQPSKRRWINKNERMQILFICGMGSEIETFAKLIAASPSILKNRDLVIRKNFHSWFKEQENAEKILKRAKIKYKCENLNLKTQIDKCDVILFESTTAALQGILLGRLAIQLNISDVLKTNHFNDENINNTIKYCFNLDQLNEEIDKMSKYTPDEYEYKLKKQQNLVKKLFSPIKIEVINKIFENTH